MRVHPRQSASWTSGTWRGKCQLLPRLLPTCTKDLSQIILNHLIFSQFWQQIWHPGNWTPLAKFERKRGVPAVPRASTVGWLLLRLSLPPTLLALMTPPKKFQTTSMCIFWKEIFLLILSKSIKNLAHRHALFSGYWNLVGQQNNLKELLLRVVTVDHFARSNLIVQTGTGAPQCDRVAVSSYYIIVWSDSMALVA